MKRSARRCLDPTVINQSNNRLEFAEAKSIRHICRRVTHHCGGEPARAFDPHPRARCWLGG